MAVKASEIGSIEMDYQTYSVTILSHQGYPLQRYEYTDQNAMEKAHSHINTSWLRYLESKGEQNEKGNKGLDVDG